MAVVVRDTSALEAAERLRRVLEKTRIETRILPVNPDVPPEAGKVFGGEWTPDVVIAMGGDGTVLRALCLFHTIPVLAVNFGTLGFLTAGDDKDLSQMIFRLLEGDYFIEERIILSSELHGRSTDVINEVVLKGTTRMISVEIHVDDVLVHTIRGDGVIVGTPTGSTSYLMSTGASIVMPTVDVMILSGINEYRFSSRSLVVDGGSTVRLRVMPETREHEIFASHDGQDKTPLAIGDQITVRRAEKKARLIFFDRHAFFKNLKVRLDW